MLNSLEEIEAAAIKDPMRVASLSAKSQLRKRFYQTVSIGKTNNGYYILLDGKPIKTPSGKQLITPTKDVGVLLAAEWDAQDGVIDPQTMPTTRLINTSIDGVANDLQPVKDDIVKFSGSDLVCYRADSPAELVAKQKEHWDPLIDWVEQAFGARFIVQTGIIHVLQPTESIDRFAGQIDRINCPVALSALHTVTSITGSALIALAIYQGEIEADAGWKAAHVDEDWQISQWGEDSEAANLRASRAREFNAAIILMDALKFQST